MDSGMAIAWHGRQENLMSIRNPGSFSGQFSTVMPEPQIPLRRTPAFLKALWLLALLVLVGIAYSFWRISSVATPKLDVPPGERTPATQSP
jgi:hypothetical protein